MKVLAIRMLVGWVVLVEAVTFGLGVFFGNHPALGGWSVGKTTVYLPGQFLTWYDDLHPADTWVLTYAVYLCLTLLFVVAGVGVMKFQSMSQRGDASRITSSRQARRRLR